MPQAAELAAPPRSLAGWAVVVLQTPCPWRKAQRTAEALQLWRAGQLDCSSAADPPPPQRPARDQKVQVLPPGQMPRRGKGGSIESRRAIVHALAHIESWAIDLAWDAVARFGRREGMPQQFFEDFAIVAEDEARHFTALAQRLEEMGSHYGALPGHDGLWESAEATAGCLRARLAIEHMTHEARGLDVLPQTIQRLRNGQDTASAQLLGNVIYKEEITHCAAGVRWFTYLVQRDGLKYATHTEAVGYKDASNTDRAVQHASVADTDSTEHQSAPHDGPDDLEMLSVSEFHACVRQHFKGVLKPPFNVEVRAAAGFTTRWYEPLSSK